MNHKGSCHCGKIRFEVNGDFDSVMECNCSHCSRKGYLLWFLPKTELSLQVEEDSLATYTFNTHNIKHQFCANCGCAPFGFGEHGGMEVAAINVRCLEDIDLGSIKKESIDGRSL
ncbi:GFA family protein [Microbulbifer harenosus]|uniref:GFA family protein n=1 Tax=Microbulbifer harenosus TaxID=2576840 RepID=A0ABY2UCM6_9GAMM|nr:GFA family protein [Microbulbifer harenosus]TLM73627.1 GFA family protein [Microbulbifer harenosus]